jgi:hypothetical protein
MHSFVIFHHFYHLLNVSVQLANKRGFKEKKMFIGMHSCSYHPHQNVLVTRTQVKTLYKQQICGKYPSVHIAAPAKQLAISKAHAVPRIPYVYDYITKLAVPGHALLWPFPVTN